MFFTNYPRTLYQFGTENSLTAIQNISVYVDIIDQIKDNINFYEYIEIQDGDRPDTISQDYYGTVRYYWTLYLLNDNIRERGWPLTVQQIRAKAIIDYPNIVLTTRDGDKFPDGDHFAVGDTVVGQSSGATGIVIKRNWDLGQLFIRKTNALSFSGSEVLRDNTDPEFPQSVQLVSAVNEYEAVHHYIDADGVRTDVDPFSAPSVLLTPVTYLERYQAANDELRRIKIIKPTAINQVAKAYKEALRTA
jgi:hypothetical protein